MKICWPAGSGATGSRQISTAVTWRSSSAHPVTAIEPVTFWVPSVGVSKNPNGAVVIPPPWTILNVWPPSVSVAIRGVGRGLAATWNATVLPPVPLEADGSMLTKLAFVEMSHAQSPDVVVIDSVPSALAFVNDAPDAPNEAAHV